MTIRTGAASIMLAAMTTSALVGAPLHAVSASPQKFDMPAQDLATSLREVGTITGRQIIISGSAVAGKTAGALRGAYTADEAVAHLLVGSGVSARFSSDVVLVGTRDTAAPADPSKLLDDQIVVTGSRIRGAAIASQVISYEATDLAAQGISDMHRFASIIPQNFGGGQNPGVGTGAETFGSQNGNSATSLNLRGLGPDATLTLLNGHRLVYDENLQGIDLSAIPLTAVSRIDVMPDGASAIYGSDAVGGVANVILKKDYQGLSANATIGGSTDGGNLDQNYSLVNGTQWGGGGFVVTGDFAHNNGILARQRSYTKSIYGGESLYPRLKTYSGVFSGHQDIGSSIKFDVDAFYSRRASSNNVANEVDAPATVDGTVYHASDRTFAISPALTLNVAPWTFSVNGVYGTSKSVLHEIFYTPGSDPFPDHTLYRNTSKQIEATAEGPLVSLPAGAVRLAVGGGYRTNRLRSSRDGDASSGQQSDYFGYSELNVPLVGRQQDVRWIRALSLTAAARYERYPGVANVATPKIGSVWSPTGDFDVKASWGKSFKAPTLSQQLSTQDAYLFPASYFTSAATAPAASVVLLAGGRPDLKPEKANSFSATLSIHPKPVPGLRIDVTYFTVRYRNRIVQPLTSLFSALIDPAYADVVQSNPSESEQAAAIFRAPAGLQNFADVPYDPSQVIALVDARYRNAASETYHGIDASASYVMTVGSTAHLSLSGNASYLVSKRVLGVDQPDLPLAGTVFSPPHLKGRAGVGYIGPKTNANAFVNYTGRLHDERFDPSPTIPGVATFDVTVGHELDFGRIPGKMVFQLSVQNLLNKKPPIIQTTTSAEQPYDFTNYSPDGRFISLSITKAL